MIRLESPSYASSRFTGGNECSTAVFGISRRRFEILAGLALVPENCLQILQIYLKLQAVL